MIRIDKPWVIFEQVWEKILEVIGIATYFMYTIYSSNLQLLL